jgi:hypothetical protein
MAASLLAGTASWKQRMQITVETPLVLAHVRLRERVLSAAAQFTATPVVYCLRVHEAEKSVMMVRHPQAVTQAVCGVLLSVEAVATVFLIAVNNVILARHPQPRLVVSATVSFLVQAKAAQPVETIPLAMVKLVTTATPQTATAAARSVSTRVLQLCSHFVVTVRLSQAKLVTASAAYSRLAATRQRV